MQTRRFTLALGGAMALTLASFRVSAGTASWNFDDWNDPSLAGLVVAGDDTTILTESWKQYTDGNPPTGGFLQLTPAIGSRNLAVVFPDIDSGAPIKAFRLTMDVRAGNGTMERPADGFSISYVRENDPALSNIVQYVNPLTGRGIVFGFAGGDDLATARSPLGSGLPENGSKTGVAIVFDAWQGNLLPDTPNNADVEGIAVRVDDRTLIQVPMLNRNGGGCDVTDSMQTGPWLNDGGSYTSLAWCRLEVEKTADNKVYVTWKGRRILDGYQLQDYSVHKGRLILAGRTGGNNQNVHFDNITLQTTPAIEPVVKSLTVNDDLRGWTLVLEDILPSQVTNVTQVLWNNTDVTAQVTVSRVGIETRVMYSRASRLPPNSGNTVRISFRTSLGQSLTSTASVTTPDYFVMPTAYALPLSSVSGHSRGIAFGAIYQTMAENRNSRGDNQLNWTEEQILGLWGTNLITGPLPTSTDVMDYQNSGPLGTPNGNFQQGGSLIGLWEGVDYDLRDLGFGSNPNKSSTDDGTIEWFAYVYFPAAGDYTMVVNSDDGFRLTTARNARDRMGDIISFFNGGRGNATGLGAGTQQRVIVEQPGVYPIRGLIYNRGGGFNVEWYTRSGTNLYLVNSNATPQALQAWVSATGAGCYVQSAIPVRDAVDVGPTRNIRIELANGSTTVNAGSIVLKVNGSTVTPTVTSGATTVITHPPVGPSGYWPSGSTNTIELSFTDSGGNAYSYAWSFQVVSYTTLSGGLPIGSQDSSKPGFRVLTWKPIFGWAASGEWDGVYPLTRIYAAEQLLAGYLRPNGATNQSQMIGGYFEYTGLINWNGELDGVPWAGGPNQQGNFRDSNGYPDNFPPGLPGLSNPAIPNSANLTKAGYSVEVLTYVVFPEAGAYQLGVNSDDGFLVTLGHQRPSKNGALMVSAPASVAGGYYAIHAAPAAARPLTNVAITGKLVPTDPILANTALNNAAAVSNNIAICRRGAVSFSAKIRNCFLAGARAVIIVNNRDEVDIAAGNQGPIPIEMGVGAEGYQDIPAAMIMLEHGNRLIAAAATNDVIATLNPIPASWTAEGALGFFDGGRGSSDTMFYVVVPQPGVYPLRLMYFEGGGGDNCEWFSVLPDGTRVLINDPANPNSLKAYRAVTVQPPPTLSIARQGNEIILTFTGTLQEADQVTGTYRDVAGATSPHRVTITPGAKFYRARN
ncbi:MAG: PA domain-containing protein [Verrucomicrobiota bacterium]|nr:hypothetical protein [Limisphaera sp.]MDW8380632.1 PA domain-containing protein [Verrucomicrobiota bacterium]